MKETKQSASPILVVFLLFTLVACDSKQAPDARLVPSDNAFSFADLPFSMDPVKLPEIPDRKVSLTDFGGIGDGAHDNSEAFASSIASVVEKGGGTVVVPRGLWLTGPIELKSNLEIHLEEGAVVVFSKDFSDYPLVETSFEGLNTYRCMSPIHGRDLENIALTGKGIWDGSGDAWRPVKKSKLTESHWRKLVSSGGVLNAKGDIWYPSEQSRLGAENSSMNVPDFTTLEEHETVKDFLRPVMVSLISCKKVLLDGPTFQNSPAWCLHPLMCEEITLRNVTVRNPWYSQNGDGLDLESCRNALIYRCTFDVGDDAICIKSGKDKDGRARGVPTENTVVSECVVYHGHGGFTVGSEMSGGVRNIYVSKCTFLGTDVGLRFKSTRGRGGVVEGIHISDIYMKEIPAEAILFDLYYTGNSPIPEGDEKVSKEDKLEMAKQLPPVTEETPAFKDVFIQNVVCEGAGRAILLQGLPEMNLKNMNLSSIRIRSTRGVQCVDADGIRLKDITIEASEGPVFSAYNSKNIHVDGYTFGPTDSEVKVFGPLTEHITFTAGKTEVTGRLSIGASVKEGTVTVE